MFVKISIAPRWPSPEDGLLPLDGLNPRDGLLENHKLSLFWERYFTVFGTIKFNTMSMVSLRTI